MRPIVKLTDATLISIQSCSKEKVAQVLYGILAEDSQSHKEGEALYTAKVMKINGLEYRTFGADFYLLDTEPNKLDVSVSEFNLMHEQMYSPEKLIC